MAVYLTEVVTDLAMPPQQRPIPHQFAMGDNNAYTITALLCDSRNPEAELLDGTVGGELVRPDGVTVALEGEKGDAVRQVNLAAGGLCNATPCSVTLPQACFAVPGRVTITIKLTDGTTITQALSVSAVVVRTSTDEAVDPGEVIPDLAAIQAAAAEATAAAEDAAEAAEDATAAAADARAAASSAAGFETVTGYVPLDGDDGTATNRGVRVTRNGQRFTFSGTSHTGHSDYCLMPNVRAANYSSSNPPAWAALSTMPLVPGRKYRLTARVVSGGVTEGNFNIWPYNSEGEQLSTYTLSLTRGNDHLDFVFRGTYFCVTAYVNAACVPGATPLVFDLTLSDAPDGTNIADEERGTVSRYTHNPGDLFLYRGQLYKATQAIAPDDTIAPGVNVTDTTVAEQLAALEARIAALEG